MRTSDELIKAMEAADKAVRESQSVDQIYGVRRHAAHRALANGTMQNYFFGY